MTPTHPHKGRERRYLKRLAYGLGIGVATVALLALLRQAPFLRTAESKSFDARAQMVADPSKASPDIVFIDIDQNSLEVYRDRLGRWPWPRDVHAALLAYAAAGGARLVVFDVLFPEPDLSNPAADSAFAEELFASGIGVLPLTFSPGTAEEALAWEQGLVSEEPGREQERALLERFRLPVPEDGSAPLPGVDLPYVEPPLPYFLGGAAGVGAINLGADPDGVARSDRLVYLHRGEPYPTLALSAARLVDPDRFGGPIRMEASTLLSGTERIPVSSDGRMLIRWHGPFRQDTTTTYPVYPAFRVLDSWEKVATGLEPEVPLDAFRDKVVFVGVTATGATEFEVRPTPLRATEPGVIIHAAALDNLLQEDPLRRAGPTANLALLTVAGLSGALVTSAIGSATLASLLAILLLTGLGAATTLAVAGGVWIDLVAPGMACALAFAGAMVANYVTEGREKRRVRDIFSRYVSPEYVRRLADDFESLELGGERTRITLLFSDIRGFTSMSEKLPAGEVVDILNEYLDRMAEVVFRHGGTLDKFIGDAVMAFWGAPVPTADHARRALDAALDMLTELEELNESWERRGAPARLAIGIGLNTGEAVVGNIGSLRRKLDYTAIGDPVNLASRLESQNKEFGTTVLVSQSTVEAAGEGYRFRLVQAVTVKGKTEPVNVYELLGKNERAPVEPSPTAMGRPSRAGVVSGGLALMTLLAGAGSAQAQEGRAQWTDWVYQPGSWSAGRLLPFSTRDADTDSLALIARVEVYSAPPRWRAEVARVTDGEALAEPVVVIGGQDEPVVVTPLGSTPLSSHAAAQDPVVQEIVAGFGPNGRPSTPAPARIVRGGGGADVTMVIMRRPVARAEFSDNLLASGSGGRLGRSLGRFGVNELAGERRTDVVASAGARGVARVRTVDGEIEVNPDTAAVRKMEATDIGLLELERFLRELRESGGSGR